MKNIVGSFDIDSKHYHVIDYFALGELHVVSKELGKAVLVLHKNERWTLLKLNTFGVLGFAGAYKYEVNGRWIYSNANREVLFETEELHLDQFDAIRELTEVLAYKFDRL